MRKLFSRYGLDNEPFTKDLPVDEMFTTKAIEQARQRLNAAIKGRSSAVFTGEAGTGKTFVLRYVEDALPQNRYRIQYIHNATVNRRDFYRQLSMSLGLEPRSTSAALFQLVHSHIEEMASEHKLRPVLLLDEAHLLPIQVLEHLHILSNFQRDSKPLLSLVLVGLPELRERLKRNVLASLTSRIPVRIQLPAFSAEEVGHYLIHRLKHAGASQQIFSEDAVLMISEATRGVIRRIDVLAHQALLTGLQTRGAIIDAAVIQQAIEICAEALI
jgi:general secretion pathway protein A